MPDENDPQDIVRFMHWVADVLSDSSGEWIALDTLSEDNYYGVAMKGYEFAERECVLYGRKIV